MKTPLIETPRLRLREMRAADLHVVAAMLGDPEVMRYWPRVLTRDEAAAWLARQESRYATSGYGYWLAERISDGAVVGQYGLLPSRTELADQGIDAPDLGYMTARPHWRHGYAQEAAAACLDFAWRRLEASHVYVLIRPENEPSAAVARSLGLHAESGRTVMLAGLVHEVYVARRPTAGVV